MIALFAFRMPVKVIVPGPDVVQVALIEPTSSPPSVAPTTPAPEPEEQGIVIEPKKPAPKKTEPPRQTPQPKPPKEASKTETKPTRAVSGLPSARIGTAGLRGDIGTDSNFEFAYYLQLVRDRIAANWSPPTGLVSGGTVRTVIYFRISRSGGVSAVRLENGSGQEYFDRAAVRAVMVSDPMPPLPLGFGGGDLGVHFGFEWEAP